MPKFNKSYVIIAGLLLLLCAILASVGVGSAGYLWLANRATATATPRPVIEVVRFATPPTATPSPTATSSPTATPTPTASATLTPSPPPPPTDTPTPPPTNTPAPTIAPPTATPIPTDTSTPPPAFPFSIKESDKFETNHLNFDVYVAVVNRDNKPLSDYRIIGSHSGGLQIESQPSAGDWTQNSGAKHYKAGNIKFEAFNSPTGVWTLQLVNAEGAPVAPPVQFEFDAASPSWYFIIFERE